MKKEDLLKQIKKIVSQKLITKDELIAACDEALKVETAGVFSYQNNVVKILYYLGGIVVFLGISVLIWQNWFVLNVLTKIVVTLGSAIAAYIIGLIFLRDKKLEKVGLAFFFISALVAPIGLYITFDSAGLYAKSAEIQALISGILFVVYLSSYFIFREDIFAVFNIIFGTWLFFSFTNFLVSNAPHLTEKNFFLYRILLTGLTYILLGYFYFLKEKFSFSGFLYGFGAWSFLGAALALGGWSPNQNIFWELIFPLLTFGTIFLSVFFKSRAFLIFGSIYLIGYLLKITAEYFSKGLGWPLALVLLGFLMMGIGYLSFHLNKKYISS